MNAKTILVVDDQASARRLLGEYLTAQGFRVVQAANGQEALYAARREQPDVILLDIMMPQMDGYEFLRHFRRERQTPVMVVTAREEETDAVLGLELGADDYIVKPFRMRELVARIHAVLRRAETSRCLPEQLHSGGVLLDIRAHRAAVRGRPVELTPIEFQLLSILMASPGQTFSRARLAELLEESGFNGMERTLNVHILNLRRKIETSPEAPALIETIYGVGYCFHKADGYEH